MQTGTHCGAADFGRSRLVEDRGLEPLTGAGVTSHKTPTGPHQKHYKSLTEKDVAADPLEGHNDTSATPSEQVSDPSLRQKCALCVHGPDMPPDLARVVKAWPELPEAIRAAILVMIHSTTGGKE